MARKLNYPNKYAYADIFMLLLAIQSNFSVILAINEENFLDSPSPNIECNSAAYTIVNRDEVSTSYIDLASCFPQQSSSSNQCLLIGYYYDSNTIIATNVKNRMATTITLAWKQLHSIFTTVGVPLITYIMDNEISDDLLTFLKVVNVEIQLVPPHSHRRNLANRSIQT